VKTVEVRMRRAASFSVRVFGSDGRGLAGAQIHAADWGAVSRPEQAAWRDARVLGVTDAAGELTLDSHDIAGDVVFVTARGHAIGSVRLPRGCDSNAPCRADVRLSTRQFGQWLAVRSVTGESLHPAWILFSVEGTPIPKSVIRTALLINDWKTPAQMEGGEFWSMLPEFFGPGIYEVQYVKQPPGSRPQVFPLGTLSLPLQTREILVFRDGQK